MSVSRLAVVLGVVLAACCGGLAAEEPRTWTDRSGQFSVQALLVEVKVVLRGEDGRTIEVPLGRLSRADQRYVQDVAAGIDVIAGKVVAVTAADSLVVLDDAQTQHKIRLQGIEVPEGRQTRALEARKALTQKVFQKAVRVEWREKDQQESLLGDVYLDGRWINKELLEEGWVRHDGSRNGDEGLAEAEALARAGMRGLWADAAAAPAADPRDKPDGSGRVAQAGIPERAGPPAVAPPAEAMPQEGPGQDVTVYVTKNGSKYHRAGCSYLANSSIPMPLSEAKRRYSPCSRCQPPE